MGIIKGEHHWVKEDNDFIGVSTYVNVLTWDLLAVYLLTNTP